MAQATPDLVLASNLRSWVRAGAFRMLLFRFTIRLPWRVTELVPDHALTLTVLPESLAICRLAPDDPIPDWATGRAFFSVTRTAVELSVVCPAAQVPAGIVTQRDWRALEIRGPFDFSSVGVMLSVAAPLAAAGVSILPIATYETDYVLVQQDQLTLAVEALTRAGHHVAGLMRAPET